MSKGIALMFKEHSPHNYKAYQGACKNGCADVEVVVYEPVAAYQIMGGKE